MTDKYKEFLNLNFYQIYPRSFRDANNDGTGDFAGITEKVPYLADLGINAVWISPFFKSPNDDSGYDISDYRDVGEEFGTLDDFKVMLKTMHDYGIRVIIDLVVNHTSTAHKWFKEAKKSRDNPYRDYYYWFDNPPNDWGSCFGGSAWEYEPETKQYYLHSFAVSQADLNWENPKVREEVKGIIDFWVDLGVDGFRCDVLDMIAKDFRTGKNGCGPRLHEFIHEIFGREKTAHLYTVGECWGTDAKSVSDLTACERGELTTSFVGGNITNCRGRFDPIEPDYEQIRRHFSFWQTLTQENDLIFVPFFENHDQCRTVSRFADDRKYRSESATMFATILYTMRGTPFILQGEEFGTPNAPYDTIDAFDDIETLNFVRAERGKRTEEELVALANFGSRDNGRRPMTWNASVNAGFNNGAKPWLPIHSRADEINLDTPTSRAIFEKYRELIALRKSSDVLRYGTFCDVTEGDATGHFTFEREYEGKKLFVAINYDKPTKIVPPAGAKRIFGNYPPHGDDFFAPFETAIYEV